MTRSNRQFLIFLILAFLVPTLFAGLVWAQPALTGERLSVELITNENRQHEEPGKEMRGGWGPHLRSVLRSPSGDEWFVFDQARSVDRNESLRFRRRTGGSWSDAATLELQFAGGRIQQNMAHIMLGTTIYSYGVDVDRRRLVECELNTVQVTQRGCADLVVDGKALQLEAMSNYIGAAVSPEGFRVLWWTSAGPKGGPAAGRFFHLWNFGAGWNGPVKTDLHVDGTRYRVLSYARSAFSARNRIELLAHLEDDTQKVYPVHASIEIGPSYSPARLEYPAGQARPEGHEALWVDGRGGLHVILHDQSTGVNQGRYLYRAPGGAWRFVSSLPRMTVARFLEDSRSGKLHLLANDGSALILRSAPTPIGGPLDLDGFQQRRITAPEDGQWSPQPDSIYNMSRSYQTRDVVGIHFGVVGSSPRHDEKIFYIRGGGP